MSGLKFLRQIVGLSWIGVFIWGIVSLFRADWAGLVIALVLWFLIGRVFSAIHSALQRSETRGAQGLAQSIAVAVELDQWNLAIASSERMVGMLHSSAYRDKTALGKGNGQEMLGPYGMSLVGHAVLLGAVGRIDEAQVALNTGIPLFASLGESRPEVARILRLARGLQGAYSSTSDFKNAARELHSFE